MSWIITAAAAVLAVLTKAHLAVTAAGLTVSISVPWLILAVLVAAIAVLAVVVARSLRTFRSSPYPRHVPRLAEAAAL
jgi:hypothetical protein